MAGARIERRVLHHARLGKHRTAEVGIHTGLGVAVEGLHRLGKLLRIKSNLLGKLLDGVGLKAFALQLEHVLLNAEHIETIGKTAGSRIRDEIAHLVGLLHLVAGNIVAALRLVDETLGVLVHKQRIARVAHDRFHRQVHRIGERQNHDIDAFVSRFGSARLHGQREAVTRVPISVVMGNVVHIGEAPLGAILLQHVRVAGKTAGSEHDRLGGAHGVFGTVGTGTLGAHNTAVVHHKLGSRRGHNKINGQAHVGDAILESRKVSGSALALDRLGARGPRIASHCVQGRHPLDLSLLKPGEEVLQTAEKCFRVCLALLAV